MEYLLIILEEVIASYNHLIANVHFEDKNKDYWLHRYNLQLNKYNLIYEHLNKNIPLDQEQIEAVDLLISIRKNDLRHKLYSKMSNGTDWIENPEVDRKAIKDEVLALNEVILEIKERL